ncbi:MAG: flagellar biosynthetic protein FliR [Pirellulales bacterium]|nr:flagellar biosynthetic protein FliR [Pirellulales bacterium]
MGELYQISLLANQLLAFSVILTRVSGLVMTAPLFSGQHIAVRIRAMLAVSISVVITLVHGGPSLKVPDNLIELSLMMVSELLVGMTLGMGIAILFAGVQIAGHLISTLSGMSIADAFNPAADSNEPLFGQLLYFVALAVFCIIGGHRMMLGALLDTFAALPVGNASLDGSVVETITSILSQAFVLGIRAAAPTVAALLLATLVMGLISRTLPQLNIMAFGFGLNSMATLAMLAISIGTIAMLFQNNVEIVLESLSELFVASSPT